RVKRNNLISFAKMHPSIALLPSHEDAAVAFAEVFFAVDWLYRQHGAKGLRALLTALASGVGDRRAVEAATGQPFAAFERSWLAHVKHQPFPRFPLPTSDEPVTLKDTGSKGSSRNTRELFWDFTEVHEPAARRAAHLGELLRTRSRIAAAAEQFGRAYQEVG